MTENFDFEQLVQAIVDGEGEEAVALVNEALKKSVPAYNIIELGLVKGMKIVSDKYDRKEYFVPDLAASAEAMTDALNALKPFLKEQRDKTEGVIVIGVVKECSQEIGKNIVAAMLSGAGFQVYDLGINVSPRQFINKAKEVNANIVAMGSPMLQTITYFSETVDLLRKDGLRNKVKVMVGGAATNSSTPDKTGADAWAADARSAVDIAKNLMKQLKEGK